MDDIRYCVNLGEPHDDATAEYLAQRDRDDAARNDAEPEHDDLHVELMDLDTFMAGLEAADEPTEPDLVPVLVASIEKERAARAPLTVDDIEHVAAALDLMLARLRYTPNARALAGAASEAVGRLASVLSQAMDILERGTAA